MDYKIYKMHSIKDKQINEPTKISLSENTSNVLYNSNFINFNFINNKQIII